MRFYVSSVYILIRIDWGLRLFKACHSAFLFGLLLGGRSLREFGRVLLKRGHSLWYGHVDFAPFFLADHKSDTVKDAVVQIVGTHPDSIGGSNEQVH